jgi:hypothetical protein
MKTLLLALLIIPLAYAQQLQPVESTQADCGKFIAPITTAGTFNSATVNNKDGAGCDGWVVTYSSFGFATVSVLLQDAPLTTAGAAGTFVSFAGTIVTGFVNPTTATTQGEIRATGYFPYVRVQITTTGTGYLTAEFHGFKNNPNSGSGAPAAGSSGCPGTVGTPCVVDGPTAVGVAPTTPPVLVAGFDAQNNVIQYIPIAPGGTGVEVNGSQAEGFHLGLDPPVRIAGTQGTTIHSIQTDAVGDLQVQSIGNGAVLSNQQAVTNAAVALATNTSRNICVKALAGNTANVYIGPTGITTATGMELAAGDAYCGPVSNTNLIFVIATAGGQSISWIATN